MIHNSDTSKPNNKINQTKKKKRKDFFNEAYLELNSD